MDEADRMWNATMEEYETASPIFGHQEWFYVSVVAELRRLNQNLEGLNAK